MASLNTSLSFFFSTFALCQVARRAAKALLPGSTYACFAREVVGAAQLGACCLEMRTLADVGPWGGGFGPDLLLTLLFLLLLVHGAALDRASADPAVSLQEFLLAEASLPGMLLDLAAQALGMQAVCALTRLYWAWELSDMRVLQTLMDMHCGSALRALVEGSCAFLFRLTLLRCRNSLPVYRVLAVALLVTIMAYTGLKADTPKLKLCLGFSRPTTFPESDAELPWHLDRKIVTICGNITYKQGDQGLQCLDPQGPCGKSRG
ncbi:hypothetical protein E2I00_000340 [Balaenoptera physalus]|uniref:Uncharacterized protein n=1 Tax=Balaenoptera physalus TaxID=9770 RepID=A0A6A1Q939_BALPH|nr:hypothetical protein E2I00_000340 [Balaenoptera physalus]